MIFERLLHGDDMLHAAGVAGTTVGAGAILLAQEIQSGWDASTGLSATIFAVGSTIVAVLWKQMRKDEEQDQLERRLADETTQAEMKRLRERVDELTERLIAEKGNS